MNAMRVPPVKKSEIPRKEGIILVKFTSEVYQMKR